MELSKCFDVPRAVLQVCWAAPGRVSPPTMSMAAELVVRFSAAHTTELPAVLSGYHANPLLEDSLACTHGFSRFPSKSQWGD